MSGNLNCQNSSKLILKVQSSKLKELFLNCSQNSPLIQNFKNIAIKNSIQQVNLHNNKFLLYQNQIQNDYKIDQMRNIQLYIFIKNIAPLYNGKQLVIQRNQNIVDVLKVAKMLQIQEIITKILHDVQNIIEQYDFFILFTISQLFEVLWLKKKCYTELKKLRFEQLNINLYGLLQCDVNIFAKVIKLHQKQIIQKGAKGLNDKNIRKIVSLYRQVNQVQFDEEKILSTDFQVIKQLAQDQIPQYNQKVASQYNFPTQAQLKSQQKNEKLATFEEENCILNKSDLQSNDSQAFGIDKTIMQSYIEESALRHQMHI